LSGQCLRLRKIEATSAVWENKNSREINARYVKEFVNGFLNGGLFSRFSFRRGGKLDDAVDLHEERRISALVFES